MGISEFDEVRILAATGLLGTGFKESSLKKGLDLNPHFVGVDSGSTDPGPFYLGSGSSQFSRQVYVRDLRILLQEVVQREIPLLIGSAGTAGADVHTDFIREIIQELVEKLGIKLKMAIIYSEVERNWLKDKLRANQILPLGNAPQLNERTIDRSEHIVAMMGHEPFTWAIEEGANVVLAGRSSDTSIFSAIPLMRGFNPGPTWHAAKVIECGAAAVTLRSFPDAMFARVSNQHFIVEPLADEYYCTPQSVAAHTLYENADSYHLVEPLGVLDTSNCKYESVSDRAVKVTGSKFNLSEQYTVKLEGAELVGYQTIILAGIRDPAILEVIDDWIEGVTRASKIRISELFPDNNEISLVIRLYGKNGVLGDRELKDKFEGHEAALLFEITASTQATANAVAATVAHIGLHYPIEKWHGLISTLAFPYAPAEIPRGPAYQFNMNHVAIISDPLELRALFRMSIHEIG